MQSLPDSLRSQPNPDCDHSYLGGTDDMVVCVDRIVNDSTLTIRDISEGGETYTYYWSDVENVYRGMKPGERRYYRARKGEDIEGRMFIELKDRLDQEEETT